MARHTGALSLEDGELRLFIYDGKVETARRPLYASPEEAGQACNQGLVNDQYGVAHDDLKATVMPYYCHGDDRVALTSRADKERTRITGPRSLKEAITQY